MPAQKIARAVLNRHFDNGNVNEKTQVLLGVLPVGINGTQQRQNRTREDRDSRVMDMLKRARHEFVETGTYAAPLVFRAKGQGLQLVDRFRPLLSSSPAQATHADILDLQVIIEAVF